MHALPLLLPLLAQRICYAACRLYVAADTTQHTKVAFQTMGEQHSTLNASLLTVLPAPSLSLA